MSRKHKPQRWRPSQGRRTAVRVGVGWYVEEEWAKVKAAAVDPERFESTYAEWVKVAEDALRNLRAAGIEPERCYIKAADLLAWCLMYDKPNDAAARSGYVAEQTRRRGKDVGAQ